MGQPSTEADSSDKSIKTLQAVTASKGKLNRVRRLKSQDWRTCKELTSQTHSTKPTQFKRMKNIDSTTPSRSLNQLLTPVIASKRYTNSSKKNQIKWRHLTKNKTNIYKVAPWSRTPFRDQFTVFSAKTTSSTNKTMQAPNVIVIFGSNTSVRARYWEKQVQMRRGRCCISTCHGR